jgi:hypothetical protein
LLGCVPECERDERLDKQSLLYQLMQNLHNFI